MKNIVKISLVSISLLTSGLAFTSVGQGLGDVTLKRPAAHATIGDKHCEKCKRGPDGKMVCEEVPCPK